MRILYTSASVDIREEGLGGKTHFVEVAKNLKELGNSLLVLISGYRPKNRENFGLNIKYIYIPPLHKRSLSYVWAEIFRFFYLTFYILKFHPEVIYARKDKWGFSPPILSFIFGVAYVAEVNGLVEEELKRYSNYPAWIMWLVSLSERINYFFAKKIICVASGIKRELIKRYKVREEKLVVISNGADTNLFKPLDKRKCRKKLDFDENGFYLGFVGYFAPWQGLEILIEAANLVKKQGNTEIKYLILGDGSGLKKDLKDKAEKYNLKKEISFLGHIDYKGIVYYINSFDVCYLCRKGLPSGCYSPLKLYEYLACGRPVIASRAEGVTAVIEEGGCGYLFNPESASDLAGKIIQAYQERQYLTQLGANGRRLVEKKYSWKKTAERIMEVDRRLKVC
ncbi:MAG: glycosyltransferase family 4 protein [Candidatus Omnitrophica bacterium]|nr:glycosyltransferase family 4 protein [Candidatus Omnitrophota bacterium]